METTLTNGIDYKAGIKGYQGFVYFLTTIILSQLFFDYSVTLSLFFLLLSFTLITFVALTGSTTDMLFFTFLTIVMNITIPIAPDRTFSQVLPLLFFTVVLLKKKGIKLRPVNPVALCLLLYFLLLLIAVFYKIKLPFFNAGDENTGFLARLNLINTFLVFVAAVISFKPEVLETLITRFYKLVLVILVLSLIVFYLNITRKLPLFNTFSWSVIYEGGGSKRMGIAGMSALFVFIYILCFKGRSQIVLIIVPLVLLGILASGGRAAFLSIILIVYLNWVITKRILIKSFLITCAVIAGFIAFSLSPLILHVPQKFQRLFIVFPKEFYPESLQKLQNTAAANSSTFRYEMWTRAASEIRENPWLGNGFGIPKATYSFTSGMETFTSKPMETIYHDFMVGGQLHNTYVSIAYIMGLPAALLFLFGFLALIYQTYQSYLNYSRTAHANYLKFLLLVLLSNLISSMFGDIYFDLLFFVFFAITLKTISTMKSAERTLRS